MSRWPPELTDALEPAPEELEGLRPEPAPAWCAEATAPTEVEVARLVARAGAARRRPRQVWAWALAAALLLLGVMHLVPIGPTGPDPGATASLAQGALHFGPSITVVGDGEIEVLRSDERGTALALLEGSATFEVDPQGEGRHLEVHAADVRVEVTGTRFTVALEDGRVRVEVERGSVRVHRPGDSFALGAGEHWSASTWELAQLEPRPAELPAALPEPRAPSPETPAPKAEDPSLGPQPLAPPELTKQLSHIPDLSPQGEGSHEAERRSPAEAWAELLARRSSTEPEAMLSALERFMAEHDDPTLAAEASALRLDLLAEQLPGEEVMPELDAWLTDHPDHARSLEIELLRATVAREQLGDCTLALPSYERVARKASGALQANAQAWAEHCRSARD